MPRIKVSQIQQGITMEERMQSSPGEAMMSWVKASEQLRGQKVDLVIWPEGATPYDPRIAKVGQRMTYLAKYIDAPIVFGGGYVEEKVSPISGEPYYEQRNSIYLMDRQGELVTRYDKMVPLPFGEYLPGAEMFPILREFLPRKGGMLSGGQQQQLAIGRALLTDPVLLILDEPTEGIQPNIIDQIGDAIRMLRSEGRMSILLVEQYLDFCRELGDSFAILERGTVAAAGAMAELSDGMVKEFLTV